MTEQKKGYIQFHKTRTIAGAVIGALVFVLCFFCQLWQMGAVIAALFLLFGAVKICRMHQVLLWMIYCVWSALLFDITWHASYRSVGAGHEMLVTPGAVILNILLIALVCLVCFLVSGKWRASAVVGTFLLILLSFINCMVFQFRGKELAIADFLSVQTALNVIAQYSPTFYREIIIDWVLWLTVVWCGFSLPPIAFVCKWKMRLGALVLSVAILLMVHLCSSHIPIKTWEREGTRINGYYLNFYFGIRDSVVKKPKDYGTESVKRLEYMYPHEEEVTEELPNVIVIMDESFADFNVLGEKIRTNRPVTPFIDSLAENTQKGYALTSVYGGNTANAEFEFLTGHTLGFLPKDCVPYQQYIRNNIYAMPYLMRSLGYRDIATHPYFASGWSRERIYPYLGFEKFTFIDSYPQEQKLRNYISDREMFEYVLRILAEAEDADKPLFLFGITMQNHGGYDYGKEDFEPKIKLTGYEKEMPLAEQYLSVVHETDKAVKYLISELKKVKQDTIVLFFGDHFPRVEEELYETLHGGEFETNGEQQLRHTVPFFIWANYDIPETETQITSLGYLGRHLLDAAEIPLPPYYQFLKEAEEQIPAVNSLGYYSKLFHTYKPIDEAVGMEKEWLEKYQTLQYNNLFDGKNRSPLFFGQFMPE